MVSMVETGRSCHLSRSSVHEAGRKIPVTARPVSTIRSKGMEKWIMRRNNRAYLKIEHGVLVDREVLEDLHTRHLRVVFDKKRSAYPLIVNESGAVMDVLHRYTALFLFGPEKVNDERYIVHHRRANKKNCRGENLELRLRADHARIHRLLDKKKGEEVDVVGFWRPHEKKQVEDVDPAAPLPEREDGKTAREVYVPPTLWPEANTGGLSLAQQLREAETILDIAFDGLEEVTRHLDSGMPIPKTKTAGSSVDRTSRSLKIEPIRLGCWRSEAALVRLLARHERPDGTFDLDAAGAEVDIHPALFRHFLKRPAVAVAVERWRRYRRLPKASPAGWPRTRRVSLG